MKFDLSNMIFSLEPDAKEMCILTKYIFKLLNNESKEIKEKTYTSIPNFIEKTIRILLDWMAKGELENVREVLSGLHDIVHTDDMEISDSVSVRNKLIIQLQFLCNITATFLQSNNLSKFLGLLTGKRRARWRKTLIYMYLNKKPVSKSELVESGCLSEDGAYEALDKLTSYGFIEKQNIESNRIVYELSWIGKWVSKILYENETDDDQDDKSIDNVIHVPESIWTPEYIGKAVGY